MNVESTLDKNTDDLNEKKSEIEAIKTEMKAESESSGLEIRRLSEALSEKQTLRKQREEEKRAKQRELKETETEIERIGEEFTEKERQLIEQRSKNEQERTKLDESKAKASEAEAKATDSKEQVRDAEEKHREAAERYKQLESEQKAMLKERSELENKRETLGGQSGESLEAKIRAMNDELNALRGELAKGGEQIRAMGLASISEKALNDRIAELQSEVEAGEKEDAALKADLESAQQRNEAKRKELEAKEAKLRSLEATIRSLEAEEEKTRSESRETQKQREMGAEIEGLEAKIRAVESENEQIMEQVRIERGFQVEQRAVFADDRDEEEGNPETERAAKKGERREAVLPDEDHAEKKYDHLPVIV